MKDRDFKMRERWEQKEYYGDSKGETRLEKIGMKRMEKEKKQYLKGCEQI